MTTNAGSMEERLERVETKVDALDKKVEALDKKVDALDKKVHALDSKVDVLGNATKIQFEQVREDIKKLGEGYEQGLKGISTQIKELNLSWSEKWSNPWGLASPLHLLPR